MDAGQQHSYFLRSSLLGSQLRQFRIDADRAGRADTVHALRNTVLTASGALRLAEDHLRRGQSTDIEVLLDIAESRLREGRALIARARRPFLSAA